MEKREEERVELRRRALQALEHAEDLEPHDPVQRLRPELRLWHYPAFYPSVSWTLLREAHASGAWTRLCAREVTWDMPSDMLRLTNPMEGMRRGFHTKPALSVRDAEVPPHEYLSLWSAGSRVRIPLVGVEEAISLDGETFGIERVSASSRFRLEWWGDGPGEWAAFSQWAAEMRQFLEQCVEEEPR